MNIKELATYTPAKRTNELRRSMANSSSIFCVKSLKSVSNQKALLSLILSETRKMNLNNAVILIRLIKRSLINEDTIMDSLFKEDFSEALILLLRALLRKIEESKNYIIPLESFLVDLGELTCFANIHDEHLMQFFQLLLPVVRNIHDTPGFRSSDAMSALVGLFQSNPKSCYKMLQQKKSILDDIGKSLEHIPRSKSFQAQVLRLELVYRIYRRSIKSGNVEKNISKPLIACLPSNFKAWIEKTVPQNFKPSVRQLLKDFNASAKSIFSFEIKKLECFTNKKLLVSTAAKWLDVGSEVLEFEYSKDSGDVNGLVRLKLEDLSGLAFSTKSNDFTFSIGHSESMNGLLDVFQVSSSPNKEYIICLKMSKASLESVETLLKMKFGVLKKGQPVLASSKELIVKTQCVSENEPLIKPSSTSDTTKAAIKPSLRSSEVINSASAYPEKQKTPNKAPLRKKKAKRGTSKPSIDKDYETWNYCSTPTVTKKRVEKGHQHDSQALGCSAKKQARIGTCNKSIEKKKHVQEPKYENLLNSTCSSLSEISEPEDLILSEIEDTNDGIQESPLKKRKVQELPEDLCNTFDIPEMSETSSEEDSEYNDEILNETTTEQLSVHRNITNHIQKSKVSKNNMSAGSKKYELYRDLERITDAILRSQDEENQLGLKLLHEQSVLHAQELILYSRNAMGSQHLKDLKAKMKRLHHSGREILQPLKQPAPQPILESGDTSSAIGNLEQQLRNDSCDMESSNEKELIKLERALLKIKCKRFQQYSTKIEVVQKQFNTDDLAAMRKMMCRM